MQAKPKKEHIPGWPKTPMQMLERIETRWQELEERNISNHDFACLMSDLGDFIVEKKPIEADLLAALKAAREELRLLRMKDTNVVYDPTLRMTMDAAIARAEEV